MTTTQNNIRGIIFDLGGVLIDWNPEYLYTKIFDDNAKMKWFLNNVCTPDWNEAQDGGHTIAEAVKERVALFPEYKELIEMYYGRWPEMLGGSIDGSVKILRTLIAQKKYKVVALTNWSAETFPIALKIFDFLNEFEGVLVSGEEKTRKPYKEIYELTLQRFGLEANTSLFIDDNLRNIQAAEALGINVIHFKSPEQLAQDLKHFGIHV